MWRGDMNTVERIVACYFQIVRRCLIAGDIKVRQGNNRQFDLLAANLRTGERYHIEAGVTHEENWCPTPATIETLFRQKFFGVPKPKDGPNTDHKRGKTYLPHIKEAYKEHGFDFQSLSRVWCCWKVRDGESGDVAQRLQAVAREYGVVEPTCEVLSLRDQVLPELTRSIGSSNYDDDVLRMLSLLEQRRRQTDEK
jgi:hypothetical protein